MSRIHCYLILMIIIWGMLGIIGATPSFAKTACTQSPSSSAVYDRQAATCWAEANWNHPENGSGDCAGLVAGALGFGGIDDLSSNVTSNAQIVQWMLDHPNRWEFRNSANELEAGDFILYSYHSEALNNWMQTSPTSLWDHSAFVVGPGKIDAWNDEEHNQRFDIFDTSLSDHNLPLNQRKYVHIFLTEKPNAPTLVYPSNDVVIGHPFEINLELAEIDPTELINLYVEIAGDSAFSDIIWHPDGPIQTTHYMFVTLPNGQYYIHARQERTNGSTSDWSPAISFSVINVSGITPTILFPQEGQGVANNFVLQVSPATLNNSGRFDFYYEVATDSGFSNIVSHTGQVWEISPSIPIGLAGGTYFVRVKQGNTIDQASDWSPTISFSVVTAEIWGYIYDGGQRLTQGPLNMCVRSPSASWEDCHVQTLSSPWYYRANLDASNGDRRVTISVELPGQAMTECGNGQIVPGHSVQIDCHVR